MVRFAGGETQRAFLSLLRKIVKYNNYYYN